jgi:hypothetical protein
LNPVANIRLVVPTASLPDPPTQIAIAVDTAYAAGSGGTTITKGVYMMDNMLEMGSTGEGGMSLWTITPVGSLIGFSAYPIDTASGDSVAITGFEVIKGNVFSSLGYPIEQSTNYWIGQAMNVGTQGYQIQLCITSGELHPAKFYIQTQSLLTAR